MPEAIAAIKARILRSVEIITGSALRCFTDGVNPAPQVQAAFGNAGPLPGSFPV